MTEYRSDNQPTESYAVDKKPGGSVPDRIPGIPPEERELQASLDSLAGWARSATDRPESFWEQQRAGVWKRLAARKRLPARRLGALAVTACLLLIALALAGVGRQPQTATTRAETDQDRVLLQRVEQTIESDGPRALAPAAMLAQEISQANTGSGERESSEGEKQP